MDTPHDILPQVRFESDDMQVLSLSGHDNRLDLPMTKGPVNFTVLRNGFKFSNRWGTAIKEKGDAYVYSRDNPQAEKVSLHASGHRHISIKEELKRQYDLESRFSLKWKDPEFDGDAIATFTLMIPPWGTNIERDCFFRKFRSNELLIVGHEEKFVMVGYFIADTRQQIRGRMSHVVIGKLPMSDRRVLHIIAWKESQDSLIEQIQGTFPHVLSDFDEQKIAPGDYTIRFQGYRSENSAYMVDVPVRYTAPTHDSLTKTDHPHLVLLK